MCESQGENPIGKALVCHKSPFVFKDAKNVYRQEEKDK